MQAGRTPKVASLRKDTEEDPISMPREEITLKELHSLLIHRIYHEDILLQQRNYNFITANVFLGAGFVVMAPDPKVSMFAYMIAVFGFLWALLQVAYGKRQVIATTLWRQQAWMAEKALNTKFDLTLFEFYELGETNTPLGTIRMVNKEKRPPNKSFPYTFRFLPGTNILFGVAIPWMMAALWAALTFLMLHHHKVTWWVILPVASVMGILLLLSWGRRALPENMLDEHLPTQYVQEDRPVL
jgi:hypothetical protein